ncbi:MAG: serine O-acetyltransferase [Clostridia bacterium]|nr:serine O-acetyltransferase [Clostridia bacterium]
MKPIHRFFASGYDLRDIMFKRLREDIRTIKERDPAARNAVEIFFLYSGLHAIWWYRVSHWFYKHKRFGFARWVSQCGRFFTGIEIHPGATIGKGLFIDHGMGVVIGETTEIGDNVTIYQGVTLGGTGKDVGKRHPTIGNNVLIGSGAKVLGPFTVGDHSKIAANAVVLTEVPPHSTCVGVPARVVRIGGKRVCEEELDQVHIPDPVSQELCRLQARLDKLEKALIKQEETREEK